MNLKNRHSLLRRDVEFTDENDHNPLIDECPQCQGSGQIDKHSESGGIVAWALNDCDACDGTGRSGEKERYFDNDNDAIEVKSYADAWIKCPCCGWRFSIKDTNVWTGYRHARCGQRLIIIT